MSQSPNQSPKSKPTSHHSTNGGSSLKSPTPTRDADQASVAPVGRRRPASVASFELASVALGYRALDLLTRKPSVQILEASVIAAGRFWILAEGVAHELELLSREMHAALEGSGENNLATLVDQEVLELKDRAVLEAVYALSQHSLQESLIVVECETISGLLSALQALSEVHRLQIVEAKVHRGSKAGAFAFATGPEKSCRVAAEDVRTRLKAKMRAGVVEHIEAPNAKFREHFNFSGQA